MKKSKRRPKSKIAVRMGLKRLVDHHCLPGTVFSGRVFDRKFGRFWNPGPEDQVEGNFYLDNPAEENVRPLPEAQRKSVATAVEAALDAVSSEETGLRTHRDQPAGMVVQVVLTGDAVRAFFDARRPAGRRRKEA